MTVLKRKRDYVGKVVRVTKGFRTQSGAVFLAGDYALVVRAYRGLYLKSPSGSIAKGVPYEFVEISTHRPGRLDEIAKNG
jgi:hypothetical protein